MNDVLLSMRHISKQFHGVQALSDVGLRIIKGEVHALVGENGSGKSTLVKVLAGVLRPELGAKIEFDGVQIHDFGSTRTVHRGIVVIYQDFSLFPNLTVAENISFGLMVQEGNARAVDWRKVKKTAKDVITSVGVDLALDALVVNLSVASQQLVAICRALACNARLIVMDEPTSSLTITEVQHLLALVGNLKLRGLSFLFISHKLGEVLDIADSVTVLRDGRVAGSLARGEFSMDKVVFLMTGKTVKGCSEYVTAQVGQPLLEVRGLSKRGNFEDVHFSLHPGEILGIAGPLGSGRTELALALFGLNKSERGEIHVDGVRVAINSPKQAIKLGIAYVPEDRHLQGLVMLHSVQNNIVVTSLARVLDSFGLIKARAVSQLAKNWIAKLDIKVPSAQSAAQTLSGGNQQRVVLAKWLATSPRILILDDPTAGIDVAAKSEIHQMLRGLAESGMGVMVISSEPLEILEHCSRVLVMRRGRIVFEQEACSLTEAKLIDCMSADARVQPVANARG